MKKLLFIVLFGVLALGCENLLPNEQSPNSNAIFVTDSNDAYIIEVAGGELVVTITTNVDYSIVIPEEAKSWLSVADTRAEASMEKQTFIIAENDTFETRLANVEFVDDDGKVLKTILFSQKCDDKVFTTDAEGNYIVIAEGGEVNVAVTTNLEYSVAIPEEVQKWLSVADTRAEIREETLTFIVAENKEPEERSASIELVDNTGEVLQTISFIQSAAVLPDPSCPSNEIWYTNGSTTEPTNPDPDAFGVNIVSNTYDAENERWVIEFDGDVTTIGSWAFAYCDSLTSVTIGDSVTTIREYAFSDCDSLTNVTIGDSVTTIGWGAFRGCSSLTSVTIGDNVTTIGGYAFYGCDKLQQFNGKFASEDGRCLIIEGTLNSFAPAGLTEYTIPNSVTTIGEYAFYYCSSLTSITIPDSVTTIGGDAFYYCSSLTSITIPDSVTTIGENAFYGCSSLREFNGKYASEDGRCLIIDGTLNAFAPAGLTKYTIPNSVTTIGVSAFGLCERLTSVTIGDSVTTIGNSAFSGCSSLTSITIPDSVTSIGSDAFSGCSSLTSVTIPDSVTTIEHYVFCECSSLTSVTIPDSVTTIGHSAFQDCSSLESVTIGDSVTEFGYYAFMGCSSLTSVYCKATTPPAGGPSMFDGNASGRKIYVPMESVDAYKSEWIWSEYADAIVGYNFENGAIVTPKPANNEIWYTNGSTTEATTPYKTDVFGANIVSNTYDAAKECWVIKFDGKVTSIGRTAFAECSNLTSVTIPDSVTEIGDFAFAYCDSLQEFKGKFASEDGRCWIVDGSLNAFAPAGLTEYTIPDSVTTIGNYTFLSCSSLTSVTIPDSVTTIGNYAFEDCSSLTSVTIPNSVTTIGKYAFYDCSSLESVTIGDSVTTIGVCAFEDCTSLTSVYISDISAWFNISFSGMASNPLDNGCNLYLNNELVTDLTIPNSVTTIGYQAFYGCKSLTSVTIPDSVTTIGDWAFSWCSSLTSVTIPDSVTTIGSSAFQDCTSLTSVTIPDSLTMIGDAAFSYCSSLTSVTIPDSVTTIGECAFYNCTSLTSVTVPDSVTTIGNMAFYNCTSLTSVYCKPTTPPIALISYSYWDAFDDNASGRKIYVPMESVEAYKSAEGWSSYKSSIVGYDF